MICEEHAFLFGQQKDADFLIHASPVCRLDIVQQTSSLQSINAHHNSIQRKYYFINTIAQEHHHEIQIEYRNRNWIIIFSRLH